MEAPFPMYHILYIYRVSLIESKWHFCLDYLTQRRIKKRQRVANCEWQTLWKAFRPFLVMPHRAYVAWNVFTVTGVTQSKETWMCCVNLWKVSQTKALESSHHPNWQKFSGYNSVTTLPIWFLSISPTFGSNFRFWVISKLPHGYWPTVHRYAIFLCSGDVEIRW